MFFQLWLKNLLLQKKNLPSVEVWGSGNVKREFLNVKDLSNAIYFIIKKKLIMISSMLVVVSITQLRK